MAPPLIDTFIVPEVPGVLYALFDYGLTLFSKKRARNQSKVTTKCNSGYATEKSANLFKLENYAFLFVYLFINKHLPT